MLLGENGPSQESCSAFSLCVVSPMWWSARWVGCTSWPAEPTDGCDGASLQPAHSWWRCFSLPFGPDWGRLGLCAVYVCSVYTNYCLCWTTVGDRSDQMRQGSRRPLIATLGAAGLGFVLRITVLADTPGMVRTALLVSGYIAFYLVLMVSVFKVTSPLKVALSFLPTQFASFERSGRSRGQCAK